MIATKKVQERVALRLAKLAERITPDHHSQRILLSMFAVAALVFKSLTMILAWFGYFIMNFCYGGVGTFQQPFRSGARYGLLDIAIVALGILSLTAYAAIGIYLTIGYLASLMP
jgi:hypothetical protein